MDSLTIQDAFAPYYAGRNRVASSEDKRKPAKIDAARKPAVTLPTNLKLSDNKPDSTTEH